MFGQQFTQHFPGQIVHQQRFVETFIDRFAGENKKCVVILNATPGKVTALPGWTPVCQGCHSSRPILRKYTMFLKLYHLLRHFGSILLLGVCLLSATWAEPMVLTPAEAYAKAKTGEVLLIDVRTPAEWRQSGIPAYALHIDFRQEGGPAAFQQAVLDAVKGDRNRPVAVICAGGTRSGQAHYLLEKAGFTHVQDVSEGVTGRNSETGWIHRGLPMVPCKDCGQSPQ